MSGKDVGHGLAETAVVGRIRDRNQVAMALTRIDETWEQLFPTEQARVVCLLVKRVTVTPSELHVKMRPSASSGWRLRLGKHSAARSR